MTFGFTISYSASRPGRLALSETPPVIGELLGHSDIETTACYAHLARNSLHDSSERIAGSIAADIR